jgi:CRISPR/Cas system-associated protein Csm6
MLVVCVGKKEKRKEKKSWVNSISGFYPNSALLSSVPSA